MKTILWFAHLCDVRYLVFAVVKEGSIFECSQRLPIGLLLPMEILVNLMTQIYVLCLHQGMGWILEGCYFGCIRSLSLVVFSRDISMRNVKNNFFRIVIIQPCHSAGCSESWHDSTQLMFDLSFTVLCSPCHMVQLYLALMFLSRLLYIKMSVGGAH